MSVRREDHRQTWSRLEKNRETMKSFIGSLVYCLSLLLVDLCESYDFNNPSQILAQSYAQRRNPALPLRTLNPAGKLWILSNFLSSNVCIVSWTTLHHCNGTFMVSLFSLMHYKNSLLTLCMLKQEYGWKFLVQCTMLEMCLVHLQYQMGNKIHAPLSTEGIVHPYLKIVLFYSV